MKRKSGAGQAQPDADEKRPKLSSTASADVTLDPDGDLILRITEPGGEKSQTYLVSRSALCLGSKVFRAMLGKKSQFREAANAGTDEVDTVDLEDDDLKVARVYLEIIHLKPAAVPKKVEFDFLYDLAVFCDKYDLQSALGPWPAIWSERYRHAYVKPEYHRLLFIACAFNMQKERLEITSYFIQNTWIDADDTLVTYGYAELEDGIPESVKAEIIKKREEIMTQVERAIWEARCDMVGAESMCKVPQQPGRPPNGGTDGDSYFCNVLQRGAFFTAFSDITDPLEVDKDPFRNKRTIASIKTSLQHLNPARLRAECAPHHLHSHSSCNRVQVLRDRLRGILNAATLLPLPT